MRILAALLLLSTPAAAALTHTAPLTEVVRRTDHIVRGEVDFAKRTVTLVKQYRGEFKGKTIHVRNLRKFGLEDERFRHLLDLPEHPTHAILFLQELDGRYYLVHERTPGWIPPHSCALYVSKEERVQSYQQRMNPGPVVLMDSFPDLTSFEKTLSKLLDGLGPRQDRRETSLPTGELDEFYETVSPYVDYYRREVVRPGEVEAFWNNTGVIDHEGPEALPRFVERLAAYVRKNEGEARSRGIEAMLMLGEQSGPNQSRRETVERCLAGLVEKMGPDSFVPVFLAELDSEDIYANRSSPARVLRSIGGEAADRATEILERKIISNLPSTLATSCYWALKTMGREQEAEAAWAECERREAKRRKSPR